MKLKIRLKKRNEDESLGHGFHLVDSPKEAINLVKRIMPNMEIGDQLMIVRLE